MGGGDLLAGAVGRSHRVSRGPALVARYLVALRVGAVADYMLASLGVPAAGLSRAKGIVAWTGPGGY